ncbi:LLM class flavin-dependent oxidoreductase [Nocardia sp. NPDC019395]|uniref:LLM class flavin-dependent oxidoreductase n=1 Tax=Nocardia sp. NPDC019395 TaxID=3154686 RepID=UPI00340F21EC
MRGKMLDDLLAFLHAWWTTTPVSWDSEFLSLPPVYADLRPVRTGGPPIWIGGAGEAAMRRVIRPWCAAGLPDVRNFAGSSGGADKTMPAVGRSSVTMLSGSPVTVRTE